MAEAGPAGIEGMPEGAVVDFFPAEGERERLEDLLTRALIASGRRVGQGAVTPTLDLAAFRRELAGFDFAERQAIEPLLGWAIDSLERGVVHMTHPRYFGLFNPAPTFPAQCADRIAASFNPQLATATTSPAAVAIEAHVIAAIARRAGLPQETAGHFTSGGSEANCTALVCALTRADPDFAASGARAFTGAPVFYVSRESHRAWYKIAHQCGIGRDAVRLVATDGAGRLDPAALERAVAADRDLGCVPVMVAATAGTTGAGMIDPLPECAAIARRNGLWYHIDAAWGGALIASPRLRGALSGIEAADSMTIDAHKWFATTMGCGMFLTRDPKILTAAFRVSNGYMPSNRDGVDPYVTSLQWSRRFAGLRLFLSLAAAGWPGYARHVERAVGLADLLADRMRERGWSVLNQSPLAVVCAEPPAGSAEVPVIAQRVLASGQAWISVAQFEDRPVIRACLTHGETGLDDVTALVEELSTAASRVG
jgi:glutamate/tyrosine decarboxylase-like PLP-dependent enzyme